MDPNPIAYSNDKNRGVTNSLRDQQNASVRLWQCVSYPTHVKYDKVNWSGTNDASLVKVREEISITLCTEGTREFHMANLYDFDGRE